MRPVASCTSWWMRRGRCCRARGSRRGSCRRRGSPARWSPLRPPARSPRSRPRGRARPGCRPGAGGAPPPRPRGTVGARPRRGRGGGGAGFPRGKPPMRRLLIGVVGGSSCSSEEAEWAATVGRLLAEHGAVLLCGGLGGVMEAAARGAQQAGGLTVGMLPGADPNEANPYIDVPLATGMGEMRNALIVRAAQAVIAIGGGWGTLSEIALAQRIQTPVVGLHDAFTSAIEIPRVPTPQAAVAWALEQAGRREG